MEERPGDPQCKHEWVWDNLVIDTYPPTRHRVCRKCGRLEHYHNPLLPDDETFDKVVRWFEEGR